MHTSGASLGSFKLNLFQDLSGNCEIISLERPKLVKNGDWTFLKKCHSDDNESLYSQCFVMENTKKNYMVGLCKANNYGGMTGLVKCRAITQQRNGMMSKKRLGDV